MSQINSIQPNKTEGLLPSISDNIQANLKGRKVQLFGTGISAAGLATAAGTLAVLGLGPVGLIIGLAAASIAGFGLLIATLVSKPMLTQSAAPKLPQEEMQDQIKAKSQLKLQTTTAPKLPQEEMQDQIKATSQLKLQTTTATPAEKQVEKKGVFSRAVSYVKAHPFKAAAAAATLAGASGLGLYALGVIKNPFAAAASLGKASTTNAFETLVKNMYKQTCSATAGTV